MGCNAWRLSLAFVLAAVFLPAATCVGQEAYPGAGRGPEAPEVHYLNVDVTGGWGGCYRPTEWTPVEIGITCNYKEPLGASLFVSAQQDSLSVLNVCHPIVLQKDHPVALPLVTKLAGGASAYDVSIADDHGRTVWSMQYPLMDYGNVSATALGANDALIGLVGRRGFSLIGLGQNSRCIPKRDDDREEMGRVFVKDKLPQNLPWDWTGYASLDLLVLYDPDWDKINVHQAQAIAQWVSNGGRLLVVLGIRPMPAGSPIAEMLPLTLGLPRNLTVRLADVPFYTGRLPPARGAVATNTSSVTAWALADVRDRSWTLDRFGVEPVQARGPVGFGRASVLLFDPAEANLPLTSNPSALWVWAMKGLTGERTVEIGEPPADTGYNSGYGGRQYTYDDPRSLAASATNQVIEHLLQIPELRPLSIWWVIGLLALLALLLGPVDYLVLKRLDRLPMTWVTSSVIIALFTGGAYYGVRALRAGSTQVRSVTVTDGIAGGPAWATSYSGIFASSSDVYTLEGLQANQWWSGLAPTRDERRGPGEDLSTRLIYCKQLDGGNLPYSLPISIWSMQCLVAEWPVAEMPFSAEVTLDGNGVTVDIDNKSPSVIRDAWIVRGGTTTDLGEVPAKSKVSLRAGSFESGGHMILAAPGSAMDSATHAQATQQRTRAMESYLQKQAAVVYAVYEDSPSCCQVAGAKKSTNHIHLVRLVVWPKRIESQ